MGGKLDTILKIETEKSNKLFCNYFIGVNILFLIVSFFLMNNVWMKNNAIGSVVEQVYKLHLQFHSIVLGLLLIPIRILISKVDRPTFFKYLLFVLYTFYVVSILAINSKVVTLIDGKFDAFSLIMLLSLNIFGIIYVSRAMYVVSTVIATLTTLAFSYNWMLYRQEPNAAYITGYRGLLLLIVSAGLYVGLDRIIKLMKRMFEDNVNPFIDPLTGVFNKHYLKEKIEHAAVSGDMKLSIITTGIDNIRDINSKYGFSAGDAIIQGFTNIIQKMTRQNDSVCRIEGDKISVIVQHPEVFHVEDLAERIRKNIESETFNVIDKSNNAAEVKITASFGVVTLKEGENSDTLLTRGEKALQEAKAKGKNRTEKSS